MFLYQPKIMFLCKDMYLIIRWYLRSPFVWLADIPLPADAGNASCSKDSMMIYYNINITESIGIFNKIIFYKGYMIAKWL